MKTSATARATTTKAPGASPGLLALIDRAHVARESYWASLLETPEPDAPAPLAHGFVQVFPGLILDSAKCDYDSGVVAIRTAATGAESYIASFLTGDDLDAFTDALHRRTVEALAVWAQHNQVAPDPEPEPLRIAMESAIRDVLAFPVASMADYRVKAEWILSASRDALGLTYSTEELEALLGSYAGAAQRLHISPETH